LTDQRVLKKESEKKQKEKEKRRDWDDGISLSDLKSHSYTHDFPSDKVKFQINA
jgi:hypothetical protein